MCDTSSRKPFAAGQRVRVLIHTMGDTDDGREISYPAGIVGRIDLIDNRGIVHVIVGTDQDEIVQAFTIGEETDRSLEILAK